MSREKSMEMAGQFVINTLMEDANEWLERLEDPENEDYVMGDNSRRWLRKIECLLVQIQQDSERGSRRSTFRKLLLLRGLLRSKLEWEDTV